MLANNRKPKEAARALYDIASIKTNNGTKASGVPLGTKKEKKCNLCMLKESIVTPIKIIIEKTKQLIVLALTAKEYGTLEIKFPIVIYQNIAYINGK